MVYHLPSLRCILKCMWVRSRFITWGSASPPRQNIPIIYICCPKSGIHNWRPLATSIFSVGKHIPSLRTAYSRMIMSPILSNFFRDMSRKNIGITLKTADNEVVSTSMMFESLFFDDFNKKTSSSKLSLVYSYLLGIDEGGCSHWLPQHNHPRGFLLICGFW